MNAGLTAGLTLVRGLRGQPGGVHENRTRVWVMGSHQPTSTIFVFAPGPSDPSMSRTTPPARAHVAGYGNEIQLAFAFGGGYRVKDRATAPSVPVMTHEKLERTPM